MNIRLKKVQGKKKERAAVDDALRAQKATDIELEKGEGNHILLFSIQLF